MRARACYKCKVFILIKPDSPNNLATLKEFEKVHEGHTILTVDYNEIRGSYTNFSKPEESKENVDDLNHKSSLGETQRT